MLSNMEETAASTVMIVENISAIQANVAGIKELSAKEQQNSKEIMARARQLKDDTVASNDKAMVVYADMKMRTEEAIEKSKVVAKIRKKRSQTPFYKKQNAPKKANAKKSLK